MATIYLIILIIILIVLIIGIMRIMIDLPNDFGELLVELFLLDWLWQCLANIVGFIGEIFSEDNKDW